MSPQVFDVSDRAAAHAAIADIVRSDGRLDILVNAAGGVCGQVGRPIEDVEEADWHAIFKANVDGAFWLAQAASRPMRAAGYGRIVNIASGAGLRPSLTGIQAYTAAKHALVGLTKQLSRTSAATGSPATPWLRVSYVPTRRPSANGSALARKGRRVSSRACTRGGWARQRTSPTPCCSWRATAQRGSRGRSCRWTAADPDKRRPPEFETLQSQRPGFGQGFRP